MSYVINKCTWWAYKTPTVLDNCRQLCCRSILINYFRSLDLSLLHACFWGVLYAMLLGKMEIISSVEPFGRIKTFLEFIGLPGFGCWLHDSLYYVMLIHRIWHLCNLPCLYFVFARFYCKIWVLRFQVLALQGQRLICSVRTYCLFAFYLYVYVHCCDAGPGCSD